MRLLLIFLVFFTYYSAHSNTNTTNVKHFDNWITHISKKGNKKICLCYTKNKKRMLLESSAEKAFVVVNYQPAKNFTLSYIPGFIIDPSKSVQLVFSNRSISLDNQNASFAPTYSAQQDKYILNLLANNPSKNFTIQSYKKPNKPAKDLFSLVGLTKSLEYLTQHCE